MAGKQVGVATKPGMMLIAYRHPDDTLVVVTQTVLPVEYARGLPWRRVRG